MKEIQIVSSLNTSNEITLKELVFRLKVWFNYLKKQWIKLAIVSLICTSISFYNASQKPKIYTAKLSFIVEDGNNKSNNLGGLASIAGQFGVDFGSGGSGANSIFYSDNISFYFKSLDVTRSVLLSKFDSTANITFADEFLTITGLTTGLKEKYSKTGIDFSDNQFNRIEDSILNILAENINENMFFIEKIDKKATIFEAVANMQSERFAKMYCEKVVNIGVNKYISLKTQRQFNSVQRLQKRADSISNLLNNKITNSINEQTSSQVMDINPVYKAGTMISSEMNLRDKALLNSIYTAVIQNLELAKFTLSQETPVIQIIDQPQYPLKFKKTSKIIASINGFIFGLTFSIILVSFYRWVQLISKQSI